jgi:glycosyltransferase involved in cell wall biosynthesis
MGFPRRTSVRREVAMEASHAAGREVALVLWHGKLGGTETFTTELAGALRRRGVDARIVFVGGSDRLAGRVVELGIPSASLGLTRGRQVIAHPRSFARLVATVGADCAILPASGYLAASLRAGGYRRPLVAVEHGTLLQVDGLPLGRRLLRRIDRASGIWTCDVEVAVSAYVLEELQKHRKARRVVCIRNGIDLGRFSPEADESPKDRPFTLGYAGRLIPSKGVADVIQAFGSREVPEDSVLLIAGDGPDRGALERLANELGLAKRTRFLGSVGDMPGFWRACDIGVVPSAGWIESFCLAAVEAMACGLPVVASRVGALPETISDGLTGTLVDQGDIAELGRAFGRYASHASLRREHGANARRLCEDRYDLDATADSYAEVIASVSRSTPDRAKRPAGRELSDL